MEAAYALCPREAELYRQGGAALEAAVLHDMDDLVKLPRPPGYYYYERWLSDRLVRALCNRPDLQVTGRDMPQGIHAPRFRLPRDLLLLAAVKESDYDFSNYRVSLQLWFGSDQARITCEFSGYYNPEEDERYPDSPAPVELIAVRIEGATSASETVALPATLGPPAPGTDQETKPVFNPARCWSWFRLRIDGWPKDKPPPSSAECLAAARAHFAGHIPRDAFRAIRREVVPPEWQKPGPRISRN